LGPAGPQNFFFFFLVSGCAANQEILSEMIENINSIIDDAITRRVFPGAVVLIAHHGQITHHHAYGSTTYAGENPQPVALDTIYDIASLTKMFTATAALRLVDRGLLALHAPLRDYLPQFSAPDVTLWHLFTHTSGIDIRLSALRELGRSDLLAAVYATAPQKAPGSTVAYSNVNSLLLGEIISALHGAPLDAALDDLVIRPLGLHDTRFCPSAALLPRIAPTEHDHTWRGMLIHGSVHDESAHALGGVAGHAGLFSTAANLFQFCQCWQDMIADCRLEIADDDQSAISNLQSAMLFPKTARLATTNQTSGLALACGLGWMIDRPNFMGAVPAGSFGHTGFTGPAMIVIPTHGTVVIVLNNRVHPQRGPSAHHPVIAAVTEAALADHRAVAHRC